MIKKLVFFLYIGSNESPEERAKNEVMRVHFNCLKKYADVFDEASFILSVKNDLIDNKELIKEYMSYIISLGYIKNVSFRVEENTRLRETKCFKEEIVDSKENFDKLVFFAHARGEFSPYVDSMCKWVASNYYYGLNFIDEMENWLIESEKVYYGFPLADSRGNIPNAWEVMPKYKYYFLGTIFWINIPLLKEVMKLRGNDYPVLNGRFYDENFPGNTIQWEMISTHNSIAIGSYYDFYSNFDDAFAEYCSNPINKNEKENFEKFLEEIKKED